MCAKEREQDTHTHTHLHTGVVVFRLRRLHTDTECINILSLVMREIEVQLHWFIFILHSRSEQQLHLTVLSVCVRACV